MSSYANAAATNAPDKVGKVPTPPQVKETSQPQGSVGTVSPEEFEDIKEKASQDIQDGVEKGKKKLDEFGKDAEKKSNSFVETVKQKVACFTQTVSKKIDSLRQTDAREVAASASTELQNPAVLAQILVGIGGIVGGYAVFQERHRINTDNKFVLATHAAIATGLVLIDGYIFKKTYPKFKKH